ncbi:hypothetical protein [Streptomyces lydicus]|uniref:hypothetical protein n=1 Tax=Streptomyces lydicus TaxID=47763 RepID=UPI0037F6DE32
MTTETGIPTPHHWVLTVSVRAGGRETTVGGHGVLSLTPGASRYKVCQHLIGELLTQFRQKGGAPLENLGIVKFDLKPDRID